VITGFNTDIEHDGVVYHVQTEDKGLETPLILSLVYVGGAILASKRTLYQDLIAEGFSDEVLAERLKRQHRLICAAINSGRINDLKKMGAREDAATPTAPLPPPEPPPELETVVTTEPVVTPEPDLIIESDLIIEPDSPPVEQDFAIVQENDFIIHEQEAREAESSTPSDIFDMELEDIPSQIWSPPEREETPPAPAEPELIEPEPQESAFGDEGLYGFGDASLEEGLSILLLDEHEFYSGETRILRVLVVNRKGAEEKPLGSVVVSIKILGTTFRPLIYSLKTDRDGVASVTTQIPFFTSGRAAVLVRAVAKDQAAELRRVIHPT
jgi:hypothetical protein